MQHLWPAVVVCKSVDKCCYIACLLWTNKQLRPANKYLKEHHFWRSAEQDLLVFFCHIHLRERPLWCALRCGYNNDWPVAMRGQGGGRKGDRVIGALRLQELRQQQQMFEIDSDWSSHQSQTAPDPCFLKPNFAPRCTPAIHALQMMRIKVIITIFGAKL